MQQPGRPASASSDRNGGCPLLPMKKMLRLPKCRPLRMTSATRSSLPGIAPPIEHVWSAPHLPYSSCPVEESKEAYNPLKMSPCSRPEAAARRAPAHRLEGDACRHPGSLDLEESVFAQRLFATRSVVRSRGRVADSLPQQRAPVNGGLTGFYRHPFHPVRVETTPSG
jgi:hypothetical protein